jgi:uncharacterized damage-inducible protein DinB
MLITDCYCYTCREFSLAGVTMTQPLQPDQASLIFQSTFLPALQHEHPVTRKIIEAIPLNQGDYRPDPVSKSAIELAWHIAASEKRFLEGIAGGEFNFAPIPRPDSVRNSADIAAWYGEMFPAALSRLQKLSGEQLARVIDFRGMLQLPAVMFLRLALSHSIHHRGQLSTYLRPMGAKVPSIYGESYDAAEARKAAEAKSA